MDGKFQGSSIVDQLQMRCPRLGGEVTFGYCQREGGDLPCSRIIMCWQPYLPVEAYLREKLTPEQWDRCFAGRSKEKVVSIVELIEEAKKRMQENL